MHDYSWDGTNNMKASRNERKRHSFIPIVFCIALTVTGLWFPSWLYIVIAGLVAIFLTIAVLFVLVWSLTRFMVKGEN